MVDVQSSGVKWLLLVVLDPLLVLLVHYQLSVALFLGCVSSGRGLTASKYQSTWVSLHHAQLSVHHHEMETFSASTLLVVFEQKPYHCKCYC